MSQINHNISAPNDGLGDQLRSAFGNQNTMNTELYTNKVDKVAGKGLSTNDYSAIDKAKVDAIVAGAEANVQADWEQSDNTADDYIKNKPAELFSSVGSFHYVDLATQTTPLTVLSGVEKKITNDILDPKTNVLNAPYGIVRMWDETTNQIDFTQTVIGDLITITPTIEITTTAANQDFQIYIKLGVGSSTPSTIQVYRGSVKTVGSIIVSPARDFSMDISDNVDFPAEIYILSDANCTVKSGFLDIKVVRKNVNVVSLPSSTRQEVDFGSETGTIITVLNAKSPSVAIQDQNTGQIVMFGYFGGTYHKYLFVGIAGLYGVGNLQSVAADFIEIIDSVSSGVVITPYTSFKPIHKGYGNTNLAINEIGDIFCGWKNGGTIRYTEAKWLGGSLTDSNNFTPLVQTEI